MRRFLSLALMFLVGCLACAPLTMPPEQLSHPSVGSTDPMNVTVALVSDEDVTYCAGTWIAPDRILTASHCVLDDDSDEVRAVKVVHIRDYDGVKSDATVKKLDLDKDLALLQTTRKHAFAPLARVWFKGETLTIVGHPSHAEWAFMRGWISLWKKHKSPESDNEMGMLQVQAPIYYGNSGGGAFDESGALVGVCSMRSTQIPDLGLFVAPEEISAFLLTK